jgi:hypothetical protein
MSEPADSFGTDILKGLKRVLFNTDQVSDTTAKPLDIPQPTEKLQAVQSNKEDFSFSDDGFKEMKLRVYQLLENMNKPGIDFFEVWNAAVEMGGANSSNIKSAFTSLKFADKSLDKAKLLETGTSYISGLKSVIDNESRKRLAEKNRLDQEMEQVKSNLSSEIIALEQQISTLQQKLTVKKSERENIHEKYEPLISDIDVKIKAGQQTVSSVVNEMQQVVDIINKDLK